MQGKKLYNSKACIYAIGNMIRWKGGIRKVMGDKIRNERRRTRVGWGWSGQKRIIVKASPYLETSLT